MVDAGGSVDAVREPRLDGSAVIGVEVAETCRFPAAKGLLRCMLCAGGLAVVVVGGKRAARRDKTRFVTLFAIWRGARRSNSCNHVDLK